MGQLEDAWAAGIIDGEGCILLKRQRGKSKSYYHLFVIVGQSGHEMPKMLQRLLDLYGGNIDGPRTRKGNGNRLPQRHWYLAHAQAETFLRKVQPYLIQKQDQADTALQYRREALGRGKAELQEQFYWKLRSFKHYEQKAYNDLEPASPSQLL
jgi:hypothetical protein